MSLIQLIWVVAVFVLAVVSKKTIELILEKEYGIWAPALARLVVRLAGLLCRSRRGEWWVDLLYVQRVENESGLLKAADCLVFAPWIALLDAAVMVRIQGRKAMDDGLTPRLVLRLGVWMGVGFLIVLVGKAATPNPQSGGAFLVEMVLKGGGPAIVAALFPDLTIRSVAIGVVAIGALCGGLRGISYWRSRRDALELKA
jgi:hypothetical protein